MNWYLEVLKKYATFTGRAQRAEYWYFILFNIIISTVLAILDVILGTLSPYGTGLLNGIYSLAIFIPHIAVATRRLHDIGKSGWWQLIVIIPIIGWILIIIWFATDSEGDNQYGKNPKKRSYTNNSIKELEKLADLKEKGIITEEEFNSKKEILLNSLTSCNKAIEKENEDKTYWLPVSSMILGIFAMLACFDKGNWSHDTFIGASFFIILSLTLGIISISVQQKGKGMAIAGITLSILSALIVTGLINLDITNHWIEMFDMRLKLFSTQELDL